jgi:hypothetical protein
MAFARPRRVANLVKARLGLSMAGNRLPPSRQRLPPGWKHRRVTMPAHEPDLTRADHSGAIEGTSVPLGEDQEVLFADGTWDFVSVLCQAADSCGGWRVLLRWYQDLSTHGGWFLVRTNSDRDKFRELPPELAGLAGVVTTDAGTTSAPPALQ